MLQREFLSILIRLSGSGPMFSFSWSSARPSLVIKSTNTQVCFVIFLFVKCRLFHQIKTFDFFLLSNHLFVFHYSRLGSFGATGPRRSWTLSRRPPPVYAHHRPAATWPVWLYVESSMTRLRTWPYQWSYHLRVIAMTGEWVNTRRPLHISSPTPRHSSFSLRPRRTCLPASPQVPWVHLLIITTSAPAPTSWCQEKDFKNPFGPLPVISATSEYHIWNQWIFLDFLIP